MAIARPAHILTSAAASPVQMVLLTLTVSVALGIALFPGGFGGFGGTPDPAPPAATPTVMPSPTAAPTPTAEPTVRPRPSPTATPTPEPAVVPTVIPTAAPTATPTPVAAPVATPRPTITPATPTPATPAPPPPAGGSLPPCTYSDALTPHHGLGEWQITLLDTIYHLPSGYAPGDLVDSGSAGVNAGHAVRGLMLEDLRAMAADARAAGSPIQLVSGYRSHAQQKATFDHWVSVGGYEQALRTSARPGHSEHQLGTAIDVSSEGGAAPWEYGDWASTPAGSWMAANAWRYGFVMSYPRGAFDLSCYSYEPWHYRYLGRPLAAQVVGSGLVPRQFLWELQ